MKRTHLFLLLAIMILFFPGCENEQNTPDQADFTRGIYIINEGSFQSNNGSISYYDPIDGIITNGIFEAANGRPLGDVVQSFAKVSDTVGIIVVNGSEKLEVVDLKTFRTISEPIPVVYPRQFRQVTSNTGYLTGGSLLGYVYIMDLGTFEIIDSIEAGYGPDAVVSLDNMAFIANSGGWGIDSTIYKINTSNNQVIDTFQVGKAPADLVIDKDDRLWTYCRGQAVYNWDPPYNLISETDALLQKIDITSGNILWQAKVGRAGDYTASPPRIAVSPDGTFIYFLRPDGVYKISPGNPNLPDVPLITGSYYGMDVDPDDGNIFVFESVFTGNGTMSIYSEDGIPVAEGMVGVAPNGAVFP
jgi:hypothetical protein